jgi:hypothetical protein
METPEKHSCMHIFFSILQKVSIHVRLLRERSRQFDCFPHRISRSIWRVTSRANGEHQILLAKARELFSTNPIHIQPPAAKCSQSPSEEAIKGSTLPE